MGGLGDVVTSLSRAVQDLNHNIEIILPKYDCLKFNNVSFNSDAVENISRLLTSCARSYCHFLILRNAAPRLSVNLVCDKLPSFVKARPEDRTTEVIFWNSIGF